MINKLVMCIFFGRDKPRYNSKLVVRLKLFPHSTYLLYVGNTWLNNKSDFIFKDCRRLCFTDICLFPTTKIYLQPVTERINKL